MSVYDLPLSHDQASIRLIEFDLSGDGNIGDFTVRTKMDTYKFHRVPDYDALSYSWRNEDNMIKIDNNNNSECLVTLNLCDALQQLRGYQVANGNIKRKLWIDAI